MAPLSRTADDGSEPRPKSLPLGLRSTPADLPATVPARMVNEVLYCERLFHLEWVQGEFADNIFTVDGRLVHRRADAAGGALPPTAETATDPKQDTAAAGEEEEDESEPDPGSPPYTARSVWLTSEAIGLTAKIDIVEGTGDGTVVPIEYKRGHAPEVPEGAYLPERAQLCAQVMLLREHGYRCERAEIYFAGSRRRVPIAVTPGLENRVHAAIARAREIATQDAPPPPLCDDPRCNGCSLVGICLPDETTLLRRLRGEPAEEPEAAEAEDDDELDLSGGDPWGLAPSPPPELRRLHPARDDILPLYVQQQGARLGLEGDRLAVRSKDGLVHARLAHTSQVSVFGNVQVTTQALKSLLERGIPLSIFTYGGWYLGRVTGTESKNVGLRVAQYRAADRPEFCLRMARGLVVGKIKNSRTMLRRNHSDADAVALSELDQLARKASSAESLETLLGLEGTAARTYFGQFTGMLKGEAAKAGTFDLEGRNRRPPRDPINALLSYCYALLTKDWVVTLGAVGLDPLLGFYHQPRFGRPALALDLMEEFRPIVADSVVINAVNTSVVTDKDFTTNGAAVSLSPAARKRLLLAYERRMDQLVTHPLFGYRISYRRVLEVQARLLSRVLLGEIEEYPSFRTR